MSAPTTTTIQQQPIDNKTTQKVKETISRMVKSDMHCASVILEPEQTQPVELMNTTIARMLPLAAAFKSGKTDTNIFLCDGGRVVLLVNYYEPIATDSIESPVEYSSAMQSVIIGVILAPSVHNSFASDTAPVMSILDDIAPIGQQDGALTIVFPVAEIVSTAYKQPVLLGVRRIPSDAAFKEVDQVMQRFYEYMRRLGLIQDEAEEDMGALADAAGIEW